MKSIQSRLTTFIILGTAVLLLAAGLIIDRRLSSQLEGEFHKNLLAKAMTLVTLSEHDAGEIEFDLDEELMPEFKRRHQPEYFQLWLADGEVLRKSTSLGNADLRRLNVGLDEPVFTDLNLPGNRSGQAVSFMFIPQTDPDEEDEQDVSGREEERGELVADNASENTIRVQISLAQGREDLDELLLTMRTTLLATFLILMIALAALARYSVSRGLVPLKNMTREVAELDASRLHMRLAGTETEELTPITQQLNGLLDRLEQAFQREKRFSGNVAHELRTPISELRAIAEVGKGWPEERDMVESFFGDLVGLADDMERTVVNLLMLARLDAGTQEVKQEPFDLTELVDGIWKRFGAEVTQREISLDNRLKPGLMVQSDKDKLKLILINVLYNAVSYSPTNSEIVIEANKIESELEIAVSNKAVNLSESDLPMMFERFWRKDQVRAEGNHAGLGLSLVKALAEILNLRIKALLDAGHRFTLSLSGLAPA